MRLNYAYRGADSLYKTATLDPDAIFFAAQQAIFIYDEILLIEYQDYLGIGLRIAQAKRARLLPPSVKVLAYAHGNQFYLDAANGRVRYGRDPKLDVKERLSLELADVAAFPSAYIQNLYKDFGGFRPREARLLRIPFSMEPDSVGDLSRQPINTIAFFGKATAAKGYPDFVGAILALFEDPRYAEQARQIERIVLIGVSTPDPRFLRLPIPIEAYLTPRPEALKLLRSLAPSSLIVLPYKGDNYALSVLEVINLSCEFLAFRAGGIPEQIPDELQATLLCEPNSEALAAAIAHRLALSQSERHRLVERCRSLVREKCEESIRSYVQSIAELKAKVARQEREGIGAVTVTVPNLNGRKNWFDDLARGLRNSYHTPRQVILIDDGSTEQGFGEFQSLKSSLGDTAVQVIKNPRNLGLAATRNIGLAACNTPYFCPHDNDNIIRNDFLRTCCRILDANPEVAAVTTWQQWFTDGDDWEAEEQGREYRPLGADIGIALAENCLGDALAVYRTSALQGVNGWDETNTAKFEDWELLLRLIATENDVWVLPKHTVLYRVRNDSMARSYSDFYGRLRLTTAIPQLSKSQALSVARMIWHNKEAEQKIRSLTVDVKRLKRRLEKLETSSIRRSTQYIREHLGGRRGLRRIVRLALKPIRLALYRPPNAH